VERLIVLFQGCREDEINSGARNFMLGSAFSGKEFRLLLFLQLLKLRNS
jgi:hypothetical protein